MVIFTQVRQLPQPTFSPRVLATKPSSCGVLAIVTSGTRIFSEGSSGLRAAKVLLSSEAASAVDVAGAALVPTQCLFVLFTCAKAAISRLCHQKFLFLWHHQSKNWSTGDHRIILAFPTLDWLKFTEHFLKITDGGVKVAFKNSIRLKFEFRPGSLGKCQTLF